MRLWWKICQRRDLDFIEEAEGLSRLMQLGGLSQEQAALRVGKSQSAVANKLRLLRHSPAVLEALRTAGLTERTRPCASEAASGGAKAGGHCRHRGAGPHRSPDRAVHRGAPGPGCPLPPSPRAPDVRGFLSSLTQSLALIQSAGIAAVSHQQETDREITLTITIPKEIS